MTLITAYRRLYIHAFLSRGSSRILETSDSLPVQQVVFPSHVQPRVAPLQNVSRKGIPQNHNKNMTRQNGAQKASDRLVIKWEFEFIIQVSCDLTWGQNSSPPPALNGDKQKPWRGPEEEATQITAATIRGFAGATESRELRLLQTDTSCFF